MRPSASIAARTSLPVRKIRTPPPKRSPPPANSSTPKPTTTNRSRRTQRLRKSNAASVQTEANLPEPGLVRPGFGFLPAPLSRIDANAVGEILLGDRRHGGARRGDRRQGRRGGRHGWLGAL